MADVPRHTRRALDALYARLPRLECKGLCSEACGPIGASRAEVRRLEATAGHRLTILDDGSCSMLREKRCEIYEVRPTICRLWGLVPEMACPWDCRPSRWVGKAESFQILATAEGIGGPETFSAVGDDR